MRTEKIKRILFELTISIMGSILGSIIFGAITKSIGFGIIISVIIVIIPNIIIALLRKSHNKEVVVAKKIELEKESMIASNRAHEVEEFTKRYLCIYSYKHSSNLGVVYTIRSKNLNLTSLPNLDVYSPLEHEKEAKGISSVIYVFFEMSGDEYWGEFTTVASEKNLHVYIMDGYGVYYSKADGHRYEGEFKKNQRNGFGIEYSKNNSTKGKWENNELIFQYYNVN